MGPIVLHLSRPAKKIPRQKNSESRLITRDSGRPPRNPPLVQPATSREPVFYPMPHKLPCKAAIDTFFSKNPGFA
jgi:hypothetical protein